MADPISKIVVDESVFIAASNTANSSEITGIKDFDQGFSASMARRKDSASKKQVSEEQRDNHAYREFSRRSVLPQE